MALINHCHLNSVSIPNFTEDVLQRMFKRKCGKHNDMLEKQIKFFIFLLISCYSYHAQATEYKKVYTKAELKYLYKTAKIQKPIGKGHYGVVYTSKDNLFAFKVFEKKSNAQRDIQGNEALKRGMQYFGKKKEIFYQQGMNFVAKYFGYFEEAGKTVLVFERLPGVELKNFSKVPDLCASDANIQFSKKLTLLAKMATGAAVIHEAGCVSRDIKPGNTMISLQKKGNQTSWIVKQIDQGFIYDLKQLPGKQTIRYCGTKKYIAPEIFLTLNKDCHFRTLSPACDIYSLGISILKLFCSSKTFEAIVGPNSEEAKFILEKNKICFKQHKDLFNRIDRYFLKNSKKNEEDPRTQFIVDLIKACCEFNPVNRPSAAQVAYILEVFHSFHEDGLYSQKENNEKISPPSFDEVLRWAKNDRPKSIPLALREMLNDPDLQQSHCAYVAIKTLGEEDISYQVTPTYGLIMLREKRSILSFFNDPFKQWAKLHYEMLQQLKKRMFVNNADQINGRDLRVSKNEAKFIMRLYKKFCKKMR